MSAHGLREFHKWLTIVWTVLLVPTVLLWKESIPWLALMSCYANLAGHFAAWQGARAEEASE